MQDADIDWQLPNKFSPGRSAWGNKKSPSFDKGFSIMNQEFYIVALISIANAPIPNANKKQ